MKNFDTMDGNHAAAHASYYFTDVATIYPITPSSPMAELVDEWSSAGRTNLFGRTVDVVEMQSEAGAAGAMHGALTAGALTTTFTASQGLLLMIPNIYKMVGELLPGVLHVSARALATHALSIFGDHQDVMACRQTGAIMLASSNAQEAMDLGLSAHLISLRASLPTIHFFDGFRTSHEYQKVRVIDTDDVKKLTDREYIDSFRNRALNPYNPVIRGTAQNPDIYFQGRELQNSYFSKVPEIAEHYLEKLKKVTGRSYGLFDYYGDPNAESIVIAMGSVCGTADEAVDLLRGMGKKVGTLKVHLYRPFSTEHLLGSIPQSVRRIAVLDRTKEPGSPGEPLYLDVVKVFAQSGRSPLIVGGRYGLGSKDTVPSHIISVFENLEGDSPKDGFTIGIVDDVTHTSLPASSLNPDSTPDTIKCKFWGLGSDGTVGANKSAIQIIGNNTDMYVQGYFSYDSKKSGGSTVSHLRFGKSPIKSHYLIYEADYIACHNQSFINTVDVLNGIKVGGIFVLNCSRDEFELEEHLPADMKMTIAKKHINFYTIDAVSLAGEIGLGNRINMIMQAAFFKLIGILPVEEATTYLKASIDEMYGRKGKKIVEANYMAVDLGVSSIKRIDIPASWAAETAEVSADKLSNSKSPDIRHIHRTMSRQEGDSLPVSAFVGMEDGSFPPGTTAYEKRGIAVNVPEWQIDNCIECGMCSLVCPHATIRLFYLDEFEHSQAPASFEMRDAGGKGFENYSMRVQVSPYDCTGCGNCADICPPKKKALVMKPAEEAFASQSDNWQYAVSVSQKEDLLAKNTIKGSQLHTPLLEFSGACPGCGETPYIRLLTQLFGERMMIANATGCSSIWGASAPSIAYSTNSEGRGPSWANSLFEDNAEFGYGMSLAVRHNRHHLAELVRSCAPEDISDDLREPFDTWLGNLDDAQVSTPVSRKILSILKKLENKNSSMDEVIKYKDYFEKRSFWMIGGDGWAYDIGYGGLDHVLASGADVNIFVMDTEIYSNTGGQASKATPTSAVAKFASSGKKTRKKDLGRMAMSYGNVYVAQISLGANMLQTIKAMTEAESYPGPSLIIGYSPCISHGIKTGMGTSIHQEKRAVEAGYWHLYRYNPLLADEGKTPFTFDSKEPKASYRDFLSSELRYTQLQNVFPDHANKLFELSEKHSDERLKAYLDLSGK